MNRRTVTAIALCSTLYAATAAFAPTARAGNVAWGVSMSGPGFQVSAGQPDYYGGRSYYGAPYRAISRPHFRTYYRPHFPSAYRAAVVVSPIAYVSAPMAYPYYAPPPVVVAPRRVIHGRRPFAYGYPGYAPVPMPFSPGSGSY